MTRDSLKVYLMQITQSDDPVASRWDPNILCEMIDIVHDEDILGLIKTPRICSNCKFSKLDKNKDLHCIKGITTEPSKTCILADFGCIYWDKKDMQ